MSVDPRLRVLYLGLVAVGVFVVRDPRVVGAVAVAQLVAWAALGREPRRILRQLRKLIGISVVIIAAFALTEPDRAQGAITGGVMVLRILAVVAASQLVRLGDTRAIASGLRGVGAPRSVALSIDAVLALIGDERRGGGGGGGGRGRGGGGGGGGRGRGGGGGGGGGGRGRHADGEGSRVAAFREAVRRLSRGDVRPLTRSLERNIGRAERHLDEQELDQRSRAVAADAAVVAGVSLAMLAIKAAKILPSLPFAPGHKGVLFIPLYVTATMLTRGRWGATLAGLTMGTVAFLLGDGKYGAFEIIKHVAPGVICDVLLPIFLRRRLPGPVFWTLFGGLVAAGRFGAILAIVAVVQAPAVAFVILAPGLAIHVTSGLLSGYVTWHLLRSIDAVAERYRSENGDDRAPPEDP